MFRPSPRQPVFSAKPTSRPYPARSAASCRSFRRLTAAPLTAHPQQDFRRRLRQRQDPRPVRAHLPRLSMRSSRSTMRARPVAASFAQPSSEPQGSYASDNRLEQLAAPGLGGANPRESLLLPRRGLERVDPRHSASLWLERSVARSRRAAVAASARACAAANLGTHASSMRMSSAATSRSCTNMSTASR